MFRVEVDMNDLKEIEENYENLSQWLLNNFCSFNAAAVVLQTVMDKVNEMKQHFEEN